MGTVNSKISPVFKVNDKKLLAVVHKLINGANSVFFFDLERAHVYYLKFYYLCWLIKTLFLRTFANQRKH